MNENRNRNRGLKSVNEVARYLRISERNLRSIISSGDLKVVRIGRRIVIRYQDVQAYLEKNLR